jgi:hypothetical protein
VILRAWQVLLRCTVTRKLRRTGKRGGGFKGVQGFRNPFFETKLVIFLFEFLMCGMALLLLLLLLLAAAAARMFMSVEVEICMPRCDCCRPHVELLKE